MTALGEYVAEASTAATPAGRKSSSSSSSRLGPQIASSNVGYQLLRKAGWQEGQGIGINQQGRPIPLSAYHQQARHGIGADAKRAHAIDTKQSRPAKKRQVAERRDGAGTVTRAQDQPVPDVPEDPTVKRQRHQQVSPVACTSSVLGIDTHVASYPVKNRLAAVLFLELVKSALQVLDWTALYLQTHLSLLSVSTSVGVVVMPLRMTVVSACLAMNVSCSHHCQLAVMTLPWPAGCRQFLSVGTGS